MESNPDAISGAWNFRDIAEETEIQPARFYRSSELSAVDDAGRAALARFGIADVADLRSDHEVERRGPGLVPDGIAIHRLPFRELGAHAPHEQGFDEMLRQNTSNNDDVAAAAGRFMTEEYEKYPAMAGAQAAVRQMISLLARERPVLTHCFAGKDRTGFTVAVVLEAAGVDRNSIMQDYLRSNDAIPSLRESILESLRNRVTDRPTEEVVTFAEARLADEVLGVRADYLQAARSVIDGRYGSLPNYLSAIGISAGDLDRLRDYLR